MWERCVGEETIVKERPFKGEVDEGVIEVPDEQDAELGCGRSMQDAKRYRVRDYEDREGCEEGENGCTIND